LAAVDVTEDPAKAVVDSAATVAAVEAVEAITEVAQVVAVVASIVAAQVALPAVVAVATTVAVVLPVAAAVATTEVAQVAPRVVETAHLVKVAIRPPATAATAGNRHLIQLENLQKAGHTSPAFCDPKYKRLAP
jgi:hypothetical protein